MLNFILPAAAYLIGSFSSAIIACRLMGLPDPRTIGSNNPGATNVLRTGSKKAAAITLIGDCLKGLIPMCIARWITDDSVILASVGIAAFLGHLYPLYFGFKGGKGVATALGVFLGTNGYFTLLILGVWLITAIIFRYSSLAALTAAASAPFIIYWLSPDLPFTVLTIIIAAFLFCRHRENIHRLIKGTESKINLFKKKTT